jgi:hypothetical protein
MKRSSWFLAIVPHKDCLKAIRAKKKARFLAGDLFALSFPDVFPLVELARPLSKDVLKQCALDLRRASLECGDGSVLCGSKQAALANLSVEWPSQSGCCAVEWSVGPLVWLPKAQNGR